MVVVVEEEEEEKEEESKKEKRIRKGKNSQTFDQTRNSWNA